MNLLITAFLLSMTPIGELRIGMPFALAAGLSPLTAFLISVAGNLVVIPLVYFFLEFIHHRFLHYDSYHNLFDRFMERTRKNIHPKIERWGYLGLAIFVAVPIPGTGAYTGALAAWFFGMHRFKAFVALAAGVVAAGLIMLAISLGVIKLF